MFTPWITTVIQLDLEITQVYVFEMFRRKIENRSGMSSREQIGMRKEILLLKQVKHTPFYFIPCTWCTDC